MNCHLLLLVILKIKLAANCINAQIGLPYHAATLRKRITTTHITQHELVYLDAKVACFSSASLK